LVLLLLFWRIDEGGEINTTKNSMIREGIC